MKHRRLWAAAIGAGLATLPTVWASAQLVSFPGAQGFGSDATGGRGGSIYVVTNNNSSGTGSFEDAVSQSNRIIVFGIGGYVNMSAAYSCASNLTILGQTAPGQGIAFMGHEISFTDSTNCIVQYLRAREGSTDTSAKASINLGDSTNMILDHVDAEFSQYDNIDAVGANSATNNLTLQNSLIADPIKAQQFNMHTEGTNTTYLNNVFANGEGRSVLSKASAQFVNNTIYDYGYAFCTGDSAGVYSYDIINNDFVPGPSTNQKADAFYQLDSNQSAYSSGNLVAGTLTAATSGSSDSMNTLTSAWSATTKYLPTLSTTASYTFNLAHAGALYPNGDGTFGRDQVDTAIINNVTTGTGEVENEQDDDGLSNNGFGTINASSSAVNTLDTVPFAWLMSHGLSTTSAAQLTMPNALGYDMIEQYAQQIGDQYASQTATSGDWLLTTWSNTTPGPYDHALIRGTSTANGSVTIGRADVDTAFSVSIGGNGPAAGEVLNVSGGSLVVQDTIYVGDQNNGTLIITSGTVRTNNVQLGNTVWNANGSSSVTYTGTLILSGGTLTTGQVVLGGGVAGSWTTGGSINWSGGTLQSIGQLTVNVPATLGPAGGILDTNAGTATISGILSGTGPFKVIGGGLLSLTGTNTYTGVTTVSKATLNISSLINAGVPSELGASSNAAANLILDGGTLAGSGTTDRLFTLTTNGGTLDNSGGVAFTNTGPIALPLSNVTLTLTGSNIGHEEFNPAVTDPGNGLVTSILKTGVGKWSFESTGNKTYSGLTNVSAGTLETLATNGLSPNSTIYIASGAIVEMHAYSDVINGLTGAGILQDSFNHSNDSLTIGQANGGGTFTGNLGNGDLPNLIKNGTGLQILAGTDTYTGTTTINAGVLQFNTSSSIGGTGVNVTIATGATAAAGFAMAQTTFLNRITTASTGTTALAVSDSNNLDFSAATGANLPNVSLGAVGTQTYTGAVTPYGNTYQFGGGGGQLNLPNNNAVTGASNVVITGPGIVAVTGTNNYTGSTLLTGGTLLLSAQGNVGGNGPIIFSGGALSSAGGFTTTTSQLTNALIVNSSGGSLTNTNTMYFSGSITGPGTLTTSTTSPDVFAGSGFTAGNNSSNASFTGTLISQYQANLTNLSASPYANYNTSVANTMTFVYGVNTPESGPIQLGSLTGVAGSTVRNGNTAGIGGVTWQIGALNTSTTFAGNLIDNTGAITGNTSALNKVGSGNLTLSGNNSYTGGTIVTAGALTFASATAYPNNGTIGTSLAIASGGEMVIANHGSNAIYVPVISVLANNGTIDITNNAFLVHGGSIATITAEVAAAFNNGTWTGTNASGGVITSSVAAADISHLTAVGVATGLTAFEGSAVLSTDVLVKYTFDGDANLDGQIDGSDYSRIDNGFIKQLTGWFNGDFNYDNIVDGSDYTLIDNTFNTQGVALTATVANRETAFAESLVGTSSVPEPTTLGLLACASIALLGRRRIRVRDTKQRP